MRNWINLLESDNGVPKNHDEAEVMALYRNSTAFTKAYVEAIFFTESKVLEYKTIQDFSVDAMKKIVNDCKDFINKCNQNKIDIRSSELMSGKSPEYSSEELAGYDFWLTRNRYDATFWDHDWKKPYQSKLTTLAQSFGELSVFISDEGLIDFE